MYKILLSVFDIIYLVCFISFFCLIIIPLFIPIGIVIGMANSVRFCFLKITVKSRRIRDEKIKLADAEFQKLVEKLNPHFTPSNCIDYLELRP